MRIVVASRNRHKLIEIREIIGKYGFEIISQADAGLGDVDVEEDGATFEENSLLKATAISMLSGSAAIADDSGLSVDILGGAPGVHSARYAGIHGDDAANRALLLSDMALFKGEERAAKFVCVITLQFPDGRRLVSRGECRGHISFEERGSYGFGYDSLFVPEGYDKTFAELAPELKNAISHRAKALEGLRDMLASLSL